MSARRSSGKPSHRPVARPLTLESLEGRLCPSQYLLVTDNTHNAVQRYDGTDGHFIDTFVPGSTSGMTAPDLGIIPDPSGRDFLVDGFGSHNVTRYTLTDGSPDPAPGQSGADFVPPGSGGLAAPEGIAYGTDGNLYVANQLPQGGQVLRYDGTTGAFRDVFLDADSRPTQANDLHYGPDGNLYADNFAPPGQLFRFDGTTGAFLPGDGRSGPNFIDPTGGYANGFAWGPDGNLYVAFEPSNAFTTQGSILRFDATTGDPLPAPGQSGAVFVAPGAGGINFIDGIAFDDAGNLYATNQFANGQGDIRKFNGTTGDPLGTFVPPGSGGLGIPGGLLFYSAPNSPAAHRTVGLVPDSAALASRPGAGPVGVPLLMPVAPSLLDRLAPVSSAADSGAAKLPALTDAATGQPAAPVGLPSPAALDPLGLDLAAGLS